MRLGVPVMASLIIGVAAGLDGALVAQDPRFPCDADRDGAITVEAAEGCAARRLEPARPGPDGLDEEEFAAAWPDAESLREQFARADEDRNGRISRDEWMRWFGPAHAGTTEGAVGRPAGSD